MVWNRVCDRSFFPKKINVRGNGSRERFRSSGQKNSVNNINRSLRILEIRFNGHLYIAIFTHSSKVLRAPTDSVVPMLRILLLLQKKSLHCFSTVHVRSIKSSRHIIPEEYSGSTCILCKFYFVLCNKCKGDKHSSEGQIQFASHLTCCVMLRNHYFHKFTEHVRPLLEADAGIFA